MKTLKVFLNNGEVICRTGKSICEKFSCDDTVRVFVIDETEFIITKNEIKYIKNE